MFPEDYKPKLDFFQTEKAIKLVKDAFQRKLARNLNLRRVSAPKFLVTGTGLQDDLAGTQQPVCFNTNFTDQPVEMVHSLAKWKRYTLGKFGFRYKQGLYTDMDAVRKDEDVSPIHSVYVDQWDWERVISREERNLGFLENIVRRIYSAITETEKTVKNRFCDLRPRLPKDIAFVHSEDLESEFPSLSGRDREYEIAKKYGAVFLVGIGYPLKSGKPHDVRAADYDDWSTETKPGYHGLNGDIIVWDEVRKDSLELSSMGIRVDANALLEQLFRTNTYWRVDLDFHKAVVRDELPLSVGGGIGQSRLCMFLLQKAHIGEVQSSVWPDYVSKEFEKMKVPLL